MTMQPVRIFLFIIFFSWTAICPEIFALDAMPEGSLKAFAISSANPRYIERWNASNSQGQQQIPVQKRFAPGETVYTAVIVTGYSRDSHQQIDLDASFRFTNSAGRVLFRRDAYARAKRFIPRETGFIILDPALDISFDQQDPAGNYRIEFEINDHISRHRTLTSIVLSLEPQNNQNLSR